MADTSENPDTLISPPSTGGEFHLPVVDGPSQKRSIRKSRNAKKRALVLAVIQALIIAHVMQWWITGTTVSPIEPSEAMEFGRRGVINPGFIFFVVVLLGTLVFGRWLCGWGCHMVMLQDLCRWIMKRCGIRPKPFRSRLLVYIPLLLGIYMFFWPAFYWLAVAPWTRAERLWPGFEVVYTTHDFWGTFPGWLLAIPFLFLCGFVAVYFLGSKGFCRYGCPYGAFFGPIEQLAPGRIRVTDACEQSGHCTGSCSSNVRVHENVREYGMVVDPGCMKCLDCVSVCPNDALYFGFGKPAVKKGLARNAPPKKNYDLTPAEEVACTIVFTITFFAFRGDVVRLPLLMTAGMAAVSAYIAWKFWLMIRMDNVRLHGFQFKLKGRISSVGFGFGGLSVLIGLLVLQSGIVNAAHLNATRFDRRISVPMEVVFGEKPFELPGDRKQDVNRAIVWYRISAGIGEGGVGLRTGVETHVRLAWMKSCLGDFESARRHMMRALEADDPSPQHYLDAALILDKLSLEAEAGRLRSLGQEAMVRTGTLRE